MGMAKQYDRTELLDRAVELFRRQGFNGTSTSELVAELGVNREYIENLMNLVLTHSRAAQRRALGDS